MELAYRITRRGGTTVTACLAVDKLMSDHLSFEDINEGFDRLASGRVVRQVVVS